MNHITIIAGARPNFMKIAPIIHEIQRNKNKGIDINFTLVHTGQHYDNKMSGSFFKQLNIPNPDINLNAEGGSQSEQLSSIMIKFEKYLMSISTDLVLVVGDVNSTMACAIVAQKLKIKVAHVEAGIRSNDWSMAGEINRLVTDSISNYFFTTSTHANKNLLNSGVQKERIFYVGNTMIDTLLNHEKNFYKPQLYDDLKLQSGKYIVITLHRPSNVDDKTILKEIINKIIKTSEDRALIFPVHPRTKKILGEIKISSNRLKLISPLSYFEFNYLVKNSFAVITDSGGITEETTVMGIPCLTIRDNTERPETISIGTNELVGKDALKLKDFMKKLFLGKWKRGSIPNLWDGKSSKRIVEVLINL